MKFKIMIIVVMMASLAIAQVNTEKSRLKLQRSGFSGHMGFTYSITKGNSELVEIGLEPDFIYRSGKHQVFMLNSLSRITSDDQSIINKGFSHLRYNYDLTGRYIYEAFTQAQFDKSQDLNERYLVGTGIRIVHLRTPKYLIANGIAGMYEYEKLKSGEVSELFRGSFYLYANIGIEDKMSFVNTIYIQPDVSNLEDYRVLNEGELQFAITDSFAFTSTLKYRYDSQPPANIKHYDLAVKNGLKFSF
jgi:putative salt-induced outer membrane protein YdiY